MPLPNFLIFGVQKAGTSSIYDYIKQHPQVYMSPIKETNFLEKNWDLVDQERQRQINAERRARGRHECIDSFDKYQQLFDGVTTEIAIGEASPNYLFHADTSIPQIKRYVPDVKLIAILRNPVDRAYSDYLMHVREETGGHTLADQIAHFPDIPSFTIRKGFYSQQLSLFFQHFEAEKIKIYLYDDLCANPAGMLQDLYQFIGVDPTFQTDVSQRKQVAQVPKSRWVNRLLRTRNPIRETASAMMKQILPEQSRQNLRSALLSLNSQDKKKASLLSESDRQKLLAIYHDDTLQLQTMLQRDLSHWLTV
ncbi:MAG: sulfotransferase [Leptolyngbyaceae cyanobacterium]